MVRTIQSHVMNFISSDFQRTYHYEVIYRVFVCCYYAARFVRTELVERHKRLVSSGLPYKRHLGPGLGGLGSQQNVSLWLGKRVLQGVGVTRQH